MLRKLVFLYEPVQITLIGALIFIMWHTYKPAKDDGSILSWWFMLAFIISQILF